MKKRLNLYTVDMKYIRNLSSKDSNVPSVSPQINKDSRPLVGILIMMNGRQYCAPLSSPKSKHSKMKNGIDFLKIIDKKSKLIGVVNFNNMIPVDERVVELVELKIKMTDNASMQYYKGLLNDQLDWCNDNIERIQNKAQKLYEIVNNPRHSTSSQLLKRCCKFKILERELDKYIGSYVFFKTDEKGLNALQSSDVYYSANYSNEPGKYVIRTTTSDAQSVGAILKQLPSDKMIK